MAANLDQDTAQVLFREGATFIFLDVPEGTEFGIDYNSWTVGSQFRGVKMIPPGIHFVYYSACRDRETAPRTGFFYNFKQGEVVVRKWNKYNEDIKEEEIGEEELQHFCDNKEDMDRYLGPYPYDSFKKWVSLSNHLSNGLVKRLQPVCGKICSVTQFVSEKSDTKSRKAASESSSKSDQSGTTSEEESPSKKTAESKLPEMKTIPGTEIRFSQFSKRHRNHATPAEITESGMDSSYQLESMLSTYFSSEESELLGEIQFSFICFLIGQVYDAFDQWKKLVHLLSSSVVALTRHTDLYSNFITVLYFQVSEIPQDFFVDIVSSNNFLTTTLQEFFCNLENENGIDEKLKKKGLKFRKHLTEKFKWDFTTESDEYLPVVVNLD